MIRLIAIFLTLGFLAACDTAEQRAEEHYQSGLALLEQGDRERALVEFRNVFKLNGQHKEARAVYAATVREMGNIQEAYSQYLRLIEQDPNHLEGRIALAEMAIGTENWEEVERHAARATELAPEDPRVRLVNAAQAFRAAVRANDDDGRRDAAAQADALRAELPESVIARNMVITSAMRDREFGRALDEISAALEQDPMQRQFHRMRLSILAEQGDQLELERRLREMVTLFPDDGANKALLIRYYLSRNDLESAESFLREQITEGEVNNGARATLVQFLKETQGPEAAMAQIEAFIEEGTNTEFFRGLRATLNYDEGRTEEAIAELDEVIAAGEPSEQRRNLQVSLAKMLATQGNEVGARAIVDAVLEEDGGLVEALKMRAAWLIEADRADEAIVVLRTALDQSPEDASVMTAIAMAHLRNGNRELAGDLLSLAVDASNKAPEESIRFARFSLADDKLLVAEGVLIDALRVTPNNVDLLIELGRTYINMKDWARAQQVEDNLRRTGDPRGVAMADQIRLNSLAAQQGTDEALKYLGTLADREGGNLNADVQIVRAHLARQNYDAAYSYIDEQLEEFPDNPALRFLRATVARAAADFGQAEETLRGLLAENQTAQQVWVELIRILTAAGKEDEAGAALDQALAAIPDGRDLLWIKASRLEQEGDFDGAITIYESLYDENSSSLLVANNLASLLTTYRTDEDSLRRAYTIARRLRGSELAPFQDTYGWISYLRGDYEEAVEHLEPAAEGLANDPRVIYHLGMTYARLNRLPEAIATLENALSLAEGTGQDWIETAQTELEELKSAME